MWKGRHENMLTYTYDTALQEASRCLMCEDAPCHKGCPATVNPKRFIRKIRFGDLAGAVRLLRDSNVLAGSTAYICPCLSTCGAECTSEKLTRPIDISGLQRYVIDTEIEQGMLEPAKPVKNGIKVAVIGSGPAGLSCAATLAVKGYLVEVFEAKKIAGGQLGATIPDFRLPKHVLDFEIKFIKKLGVKFHLGSRIDDPNSLKRRGFQAVFVATGLGSSRSLGITGEKKKGVMSALDFLERCKNKEKLSLGKRVLIVGGGDTAIDSARSARRMGAEALLLYRRGPEDMPAYRPDIAEAFDEGVEFWFRVVPIEILGKERVEGIRLRRVKWLGRGRQANRYKFEGPAFDIRGDAVINAVGQVLDDDFGLKPGEGMVSPGIFAGGDFACGASTAAAAIGSGRRAADEIDMYLANSTPLMGKGKKEDGISRLSFYSAPSIDISVNFCGLRFETPFILAAAPPTDDTEMLERAFCAGWSGAVLKTTSVEGTPVPLKYPMMTSVDYEGQKLSALGNIDLISEHCIDIVEKRVKRLKSKFPEKVVIGSIMGSRKEEWEELVFRLSEAGADMIECSFSCPQGSLGSKPGQMIGQDAALIRQVAGWVKAAARSHRRNIPVAIKITPHVTDVVEMANAVKEAGADAITASNTVQSLMGINLDTWIPNPNVGGCSSYSGMSGPAIKPMTLKVISEIAKKTGIPIAGTGGAVTWRDAVEFILCGATIVQFCTAVMHYGYDIIDDLKDGLIEYLRRRKIKRVSELIGGSLKYIVTHDELLYKKKVVSKIDDKKCIRDDLCYIVCRDGGHAAIALDAFRRPVVNEEKCVGCGLCRLVCPVTGCIEIE